MATEVSTLELKIDADGMITGTARAGKSLGDLEDKGNKTAKGLQSAFAGLAAYLSARSFLSAFNAIADATKDAQLAQVRLEGVLRSTGNIAGFTATQLNDLADEMSRNTLFDDEAIKNASARLATFGNVVGETFERAMRLGADLATLTGDDITGSMFLLGKALEDPIRGMQQLTRAGIALSESERAAITAAIRHGDVAHAQGIILDALQEKVGGLANAAHGGLTGSLHDLTLEWGNLLETIGQTPGFAQTAANAIALVADAVHGLLLTLAPTKAMLEETLRADQAKQIEELNRTLARGPAGTVFDLGGHAVQSDTAGFLRDVQQKSDAISDLQSRIESLRGESLAGMQAAGAAARAAAAHVLDAVSDGSNAEKKMSAAHKAAVDMFIQSMQNEAAARDANNASAQAQSDKQIEIRTRQTAIWDAENEKLAAIYNQRQQMAQAWADKQIMLMERAKAAEAAYAEKLRQGNLDQLKNGDPTGKGGAGGLLGLFGGVAGIGGGGGGGILELFQAIPGIGAVAGPVAGLLGKLGEAIFGAGDAAEIAARSFNSLARIDTLHALDSWRRSIEGNPLQQALGDIDDQFRSVRQRIRDTLRGSEASGAEREAERIRDKALQQAKDDDAQKQRELQQDYAIRSQRAKGLAVEADAQEFAIAQQREYAKAVKDGADATTLAALAAAQQLEARQREIALAVARTRSLEDLNVRALRAAGQDDQAEAMAFRLQQEREYAAAIERGADAAYLARLRQVQLAEATTFAGEKIKATITGLAGTVDALRAFGLSMQFGSTSTASPMAQYAAARTQYDSILKAAMGGDQSAANRLPEAARAFLDASRAVNASSMAYQRDAQAVQNAVETVAQLFEAQKTAAEASLDELSKINQGVAAIVPVLERNLAVLTGGLKDLADAQTGMAIAIADNTRKISQALEGLKVGAA